tara:strand:- start:159 stop:560 length:402 start_codon:yes stop_codon:yes gene_type:complete
MPNSPQSDEPKKFSDYKNGFWIWVIERLGFPTVLVLVGLYSIQQTANWIAPRIDKITEKHIEFMGQTEIIQRESVELQRQNSTLLKARTPLLDHMSMKVDSTATIAEEHRKMTTEIRDDVKEIKSAVVPKGTK